MNTSQEYFLMIVQEKSLVHAAEKLYITPQNLSNHIKRLETKYGTLFLRTPHFKLTPAGEALLEAINNIQVIEKNLDAKIKTINGAESACVRVGLHSSRARFLLTHVIHKYREKYPNVKLIFHFHNVQLLEQMLLKGDLDFFFAVDPMPNDDFEEILLGNEPLYFVASSALLKEQGVEPANDIIRIEDLPKFKYILYPETTRHFMKIDLFSRSHGIKLDCIMNIEDFETQIILAIQRQGACFIPKMLLHNIIHRNRALSEERKLCVYEIEQFNLTSRAALVTHHLTHRTEYVNGLIEAIKDVYINKILNK